MIKPLFRNVASIICLLLIAAPVVVVCNRYHGLYFLLYLFFWVMLPGYLFLHILKQNCLECKTKTLGFIYAFLLGSVSLFLEFFILHLLNFIELIKFINPILSIISFVIFYRAYKSKQLTTLHLKHVVKTSPQHLPFVVFWLITTYLCAFSLNFFMPNAESVYFQDFTWQIGNINQLASAHPFEDIRIANVDFKYHYFNTLFYAIEKIIFDISGWIIFTQHQIIIMPLLISLSFYNLFSSITKNKFVIVLFSIFTLTGFSISAYYNGFMYHLISNVNAIALTTIVSLALFMVILPLLKEDITIDKKSISHIIFSVLLLFYISGLKGPFGAIFICAIICYILMQLLRKIKPTKVILALVACLLALFLPLYNLLLSSGASTYFLGSFFSGILSTVALLPFFYDMPPLPGLRVVLLIPSLLFTFTIILLPLILAALDCVLYVFRKKTLPPCIIFASLLTVIGISAYYFFDAPGNGQLYFLFCALPFAGYIALNKMLELCKPRPVFSSVSIALTICFCVSGLLFNYQYSLSVTSFSEIAKYFTNKPTEIDHAVIEEHQAFTFLKEHIQDDRLIFTNLFTATNSSYETYHKITAFSEKRTYFEGYLYAERNLAFDKTTERLAETTSFFNTDLSLTQKYNFALENNIGYIFIFNAEISENSFLTPFQNDDFFKLIYLNNTITIYEVR